MSDEELLKTALRQKDDGNAKFKATQFKSAEGHYRDALSHLDTCKINNEEIDKLKVVCYQNLSVCLNKTGDYKDVILNCTLAIGVNPEAVKAFYQRYLAHLKMKNFEEAMLDIKAAIRISPKEKKFRDDFEMLKAEKKKYNQS